MIHPNQQAVDYIFDIFSQTFLSPITRQCNQDIQRLQASLSHRVRFPQSLSHRKHLDATYHSILSLQSKYKTYDGLSFEEEKLAIERRLADFDRTI
jgi:hypothetical protein